MCLENIQSTYLTLLNLFLFIDLIKKTYVQQLACFKTTCYSNLYLKLFDLWAKI